MDKNRLQMILKYLDFEKLTDWEEEFLISVEEQFKRRGYLTEKQEKIVEEIWRKNNA